MIALSGKNPAGWSVAGVAFTLFAPAGPSLADTLLVPSDFGTIQGAIDAADSGDTIVVAPGTYTENLQLRSNIDVRGVEAARTLLQPEDEDVAAVTIAGASAVRFSNFALIDASLGVAVTTSSGVDIANVVFDRVSDVGLTIDGGSSVSATNNVFFENGVAVSRGSTAVEVESNIFDGNGTSIETALLFGEDPAANMTSNCFWQNDDDQGVGLGASATFGDPRFVAPANRDFHLREGSACIDVGRGVDVIDNSTADAGAYGGPFADPFPFPVAAPSLADASSADPPALNISVSWDRNLDYRVTNSVVPGGYAVHYKRGGDASEPFDGIDAGGGTLPSPIDVGNVTTFVLENLASDTVAPLAPTLLTADGRNESVILTWEAAENATSYRVQYGVGAVSENVVEAGNVTSFTVTGLGNGTTYRFAVVAVNRPTYHVAVTAIDNSQNRNQSAIVGVGSISIGTGSESPPSAELSATPGPITPFPDLPDEGCFIATAAFGADWTAPVSVLRHFRDRVLRAHAAGRWLVRQYYAWGPRAAAFLQEHQALKPLVRAALWPAVIGALLWLEAAPALAIVAAVIVLLVLRRLTIGSSWRRYAVRAIARLRTAALRLRVAGPAPVARQRHSEREVTSSSKPLLLRMRVGRRRLGAAAFVLLALLAAGTVAAQPAEKFSPRWMYEIKAGYFYPGLDNYEDFYGDDHDTSVAVAGSYRLRDWLEIGAEIGYLSDDGLGVSSDGTLVDVVELTLAPLYVFANFIYQPDVDRRWVPYGGIGLAATWYEQDVELQPDRDGRTDVGPVVRVGVRWLFASDGPRPAGMPRAGSIYSRSYVFFEAQRADTEIDAIELGGHSYVVGFRAEFELGR